MSLFQFFPVTKKLAAPASNPNPNENLESIVFCHPRSKTGDFVGGKRAAPTATIKSVLGPVFELGPLLALKGKGHVEITETTTFADIAEDGRAFIGPDLHRQRCKPKK